MARLALKIGVWCAGVPLALALTYLGAAALCGLIITGGKADSGPRDIRIFVRSNGVHADLVLPVSALDIDWRKHLLIEDPDVLNGGFAYLSFGWGDRGFYLTTPTWSDFKLPTALKALSGLDSTVMHVEAANAPASGPLSAELRLSAEQYRRLADFVDQSFVHDAEGAPIPIPGAHYGPHDAFYAARGHYSPIDTCNEWTREALAHADLRTPLWAPFDVALFHHLRS
jgi:uncharacterized protein (TIGR02117 family)